MSLPQASCNLCKAAFCLVVASLVIRLGIGSTAAFAQEPEPTPTVDPLAVPELPQNPTQVDVGRVSYYYNCMPCHGDKGQGLTEAWRMTWVEDHRNCWDRGCHGGRVEDEGFPLPEVVSAVAGPEADLGHFQLPEDLFQFLVDTHPPQRPGVLHEDEYWALTAFLLTENGRLNPGINLGSATDLAIGSNAGLSIILILAIMSSGLVILYFGRRRK